MSNTQLPAEVVARIEQEAKQFAFYNYCSASINNEAKFEDVNTWPYAAQVSYHTIKNYMGVNGICWPYKEPTLPMEYATKAYQAQQEIDSLTNQLKKQNEVQVENMKLLRREYKKVKRRLEKAEDLLNESSSQIEYLHNKFQATGSGNNVLSRIKTFLDGTK